MLQVVVGANIRRLLMRLYLVLLACLFCLVPTRAHAQHTINLSHDLVRFGIASQNLLPNKPSVDARPLFQAALQYVASHNTALVTLDHGAYYFLTPQLPTAYLQFSAISNLTVDFAGSTVYFAGAFLQEFSLTDCRHVTLRNFVIDFLHPPYTYVQLETVDSTSRTLTYKTLPGWPDPTTLTTPAGVSVVLWAVAFRNQMIVPATSRMQVAQPIASNVLSLVQDNTPWTQSATLATLQPDDIIAVTQRGGQPALQANGGDSIRISHAAFYGASTMAVLLNAVSNSTVDYVQVRPRKGNLISSNADGIHFVESGSNNHIRNCYVTRTMDDALVIDSLDVATLPSATLSGATQITVNRMHYSRFPNGTLVNFVAPDSDSELTGATIVLQDPPDSDSPVFDGTVTLTFDQPLPALAAGSGMAFASPSRRGEGSSIENNRAEEILFGRGIWIGGSEGITIKGNYVGRTSDGGIVVYQGIMSYPVPPAHDIVIQNNVVYGSMGPMASGSGSQLALGGIMVDSVNNINGFVTQPPNTNISIQYNRVLSSGRSGIWVGQLDGGAIQHNSIVGYNRYPKLPIFGVSPAEGAQLLQDFKQPLVVHDNENVSVSDNSISQ
jgi:parallel beta-helix repeat protein